MCHSHIEAYQAGQSDRQTWLGEYAGATVLGIPWGSGETGVSFLHLYRTEFVRTKLFTQPRAGGHSLLTSLPRFEEMGKKQFDFKDFSSQSSVIELSLPMSISI